MDELLASIHNWRRQASPVALATVVETWGSAPRPLGAKMAVTADGGLAGSVSGGCVEGAVLEEAASVLDSGEARLVGYGVSDETAWSVGLTCGGRIAIFVEPLEDVLFAELAACIERDELVVRAVVLEGPGMGSSFLVWPGGQTLGDLGSPRLNQRAGIFAERQLADLTSARKSFDLGGEAVDVFFDVHAPRPQLVVVGAVHVAIPLVDLARRMGFRTVVVDPRATFATRERFPDADELIVDWPVEAMEKIGLTENTYVAVLAHDLKIDRPALETALRSRARYVGALGSRRTHAKRIESLREGGLSDEEIDRIHAPIGLDLGGREARDIALSVLAQMVAVSHGRPG